jgi:transposase-like protein
MKDLRKLPRRRHSKEFKEQVLPECAQPGASVAGSTTGRASSPWSATCAGSGPVPSARSWSRRPWQRTSSGIPTAGLLAYVLVAKFADHLPLSRRHL